MIDPLTALAGLQSAIGLVKKAAQVANDLGGLGVMVGRMFDAKSQATKAFKPLLQELKVDREAWARAQEECARSAEQLCAAIQANADAKVQAVSSEAAAPQQQVRVARDECHTSARPPSAPLR